MDVYYNVGFHFPLFGKFIPPSDNSSVNYTSKGVMLMDVITRSQLTFFSLKQFNNPFYMTNILYTIRYV